MPLSPTALRPLFVAATLCAAGAANATITFVSNANTAPFNTAGKDTFSDLPLNSDLQALSLTRNAGGLPYTLATTYGNATYSDLFTVPAAGGGAVSTGWYADSLVFTLLSTPVLAFGANFFGTNVLGEVASGGLTITVTDIAGTSKIQTITGGSAGAFAGFLSDVPLRLITVAMSSPNTNTWASVDNVVLSAVPEPGRWSLLLAGGAALLRGAGRRRS